MKELLIPHKFKKFYRNTNIGNPLPWEGKINVGKDAKGTILERFIKTSQPIQEDKITKAMILSKNNIVKMTDIIIHFAIIMMFLAKQLFLMNSKLRKEKNQKLNGEIQQ